MRYTWRYYREWSRPAGLRRFRVLQGQTDLEIAAGRDCTELACRLLSRARRAVLQRVEADPRFLESLVPVAAGGTEPEPVASMLRAAALWDVGPMAAVAGAIAGAVGRGLRKAVPAAVVENGGDIFAFGGGDLVLGLYAGEDSPFRRSVSFSVDVSRGAGICTSSGRVGHSLSLGRADAVTAVAEDPAVADAAATSLANRIASGADLEAVMEAASSSGSLTGALACCGGRLAVWGLRLLRPVPQAGPALKGGA